MLSELSPSQPRVVLHFMQMIPLNLPVAWSWSGCFCRVDLKEEPQIWQLVVVIYASHAFRASSGSIPMAFHWVILKLSGCFNLHLRFAALSDALYSSGVILERPFSFHCLLWLLYSSGDSAIFL